MLINSRSNENIVPSERDQIILQALLAKHDLSDMDLQTFLKNQLNNTKFTLNPKEDLLLKTLKRNNDLE